MESLSLTEFADVKTQTLHHARIGNNVILHYLSEILTGLNEIFKVSKKSLKSRFCRSEFVGGLMKLLV